MAEKIQKQKMSLASAKRIIGNVADWELKVMKKALSFSPLMNSKEDEIRLKAIKVILYSKRRKN